MKFENRTADNLINILAACAAILSVVGTGYVINHAFQARRDEDDASALVSNAISGDVGSQRKLAACYVEGCPPLPRSQIISCAWRSIILEVAEKEPEDSDRFVAACETLSESDLEISRNAKATLSRRIDARRAAAQLER
jgi:small ligand-binding sensory domain FIST